MKYPIAIILEDKAMTADYNTKQTITPHMKVSYNRLFVIVPNP